MTNEELNSSCLFQTERDLTSIFPAKAKKTELVFYLPSAKSYIAMECLQKNANILKLGNIT